MGRGTPKKNEPETPQLHESRNPPGFEPLCDLQAGICDPKYPFDIRSIKPLLFGRHYKSADRLRVVASGFYHHITPQVHSCVDFIVWLRDSYDVHRDTFVSPQGNIIFSLSPDVIRQALHFPSNDTYFSFKDETLLAQFNKLSREARRAFIAFITIDQATALPPLEPFLLSLFAEKVRPVLSLTAGLLGLGSPEDISSVCIRFLWLMTQNGITLDIPGFLSFTIRTQFRELAQARKFRFCSLVFYLFLFQHADKFNHLGLDRMYSENSQPRPVFDWNFFVRQLPRGEGYVNFVNTFMSIAYTIIHDAPSPRVFP